MKKIFLAILIGCGWSSATLQSQTFEFPFQNPELSREQRVNDLISRLTLEEKVQLMKHASPAVARLGIPAYHWWNEALHGVARTS